MRVSVTLAIFSVTALLTSVSWSPTAQVSPSPAQPVAKDVYGDPLPPGAVVRLGTIRFRRTAESGFHGPAGLVFLADNKVIVTAQVQDLQFWNTADGRLLRTVRSPVTINGFAITADRAQIAVAGSRSQASGEDGPGEVHILDVASGKSVRVFSRADPREIYSSKLAFSADGVVLFSVGSDAPLRAEEVASGQELLRKQFGRDSVSGLVLSSDGTHIALATGPNTSKLYLWKWRDEEPRLLMEKTRVTAVRFSPDGQLLAAVAEDRARVLAWHTADRKVAFQRNLPGSEGATFDALEFTSDNRTLVAASRAYNFSGRNQILMFDAATGESKGMLPGGGARLALSPDSKLVACPRGQGLQVFDLATRVDLTGNHEGHITTPMGICFSPHGQAVTRSDDNTVRIWDAKTGRHQCVHRFDAWVRDVALSPDGRWLVASCFDDTVRVIAMESGKEVYCLPGHGGVGGHRTLAFAPDGQSFLSWGDDFYLRRWDVKTGRALLEHAIRPSGVEVPDPDVPARGLSEISAGPATVTPDGKTFLLNCAGYYYFFDVATGKETRKIPHGTSYGSLAISPNGRYLVTSHWGRSADTVNGIMLRDLETGNQVAIPLPGTVAGPVAFSPDGRSFATSVEEAGEIRVFETASAKERYRIRNVPGRCWSLAFLPDGRRLASGLTDSTVLIWDLTARPSG